MKIVNIIEKNIDKIHSGQVFTYADFDVKRKSTIVKTLNNFVAR
jgi:hypothetical protein